MVFVDENGDQGVIYDDFRVQYYGEFSTEIDAIVTEQTIESTVIHVDSSLSSIAVTPSDPSLSRVVLELFQRVPIVEFERRSESEVDNVSPFYL